MKKILLILSVLVLSTSTISFGQKGEKATHSTKEGIKEEKFDELIPFYTKMYQNALSMRDELSARNALFALYTITPTDTAVQMKLLELYFELKNYNQAMFLAERIYKNDNNNVDALDILAKSMETLKNFPDAVLYYETLFLRTKNSYYQYLSAYCQYQLFRNYECSKYLVGVLQNPDLDKQTVVIDYGEDKTQEVPLRAAVLNLYGLVKLELKEKDEAIIQFNEALRIYPDFMLPRQNLDELAKTNNQ